MADEPPFNCGHRCCNERNDPRHDHFLTNDRCPACAAIRSTEADQLARALDDLDWILGTGRWAQ